MDTLPAYWEGSVALCLFLPPRSARAESPRVAVAAAVVCGVLVTGSVLAGGRDAAASAAVDPKGVKSNEDRIAYLGSYGWTVSEEPVSVEELLIPEEFDETYSQYLELQASQGFDLTQYCGKRVKRYTTRSPTTPPGRPMSRRACSSTKIPSLAEMCSPPSWEGSSTAWQCPPDEKNAALAKRRVFYAFSSWITWTFK